MRINFNENWEFKKLDENKTLETVTLPHTVRLETLTTGQSGKGEENEQWQGICSYKKVFTPSDEYKNKKLYLHFEAAMNVADIYINDKHLIKHMGGFVPFTLDITDYVKFNEENIIIAELDNNDNAVTGPKPLEILDFNMYHGLYRNVYLIVKEQVHITDPILANKPASGGVFITYPQVKSDVAIVQVQTHISNEYSSDETIKVRSTLLDIEDKVIASIDTECSMNSCSDKEVTQQLLVEYPILWSVKKPYLYKLLVELVKGDKVLDSEVQKVGIRHFKINKEGFWLNGEKTYLRGANRHQEYPYIGYAVPDSAQYRDARKIKEAGFDYIRLSHYLHAPAFMDACDELGILVMNCIPGWQYYGDESFEELQYQNTREMIRRDRNHPCVLLWESSLNETGMKDHFIKRTHEITHEEYPGDQCFTCGWMKGYDVFGQARQHGGCKGETEVPCVVTEYGDWEYYANNEGFNQDDWGNLKSFERNSRQLRGDGEIRLLQQAMNYQEAHNDNRKTTAFADSIWIMYDYNRGYASDLEASGIMDITRLHKYSYYFFRSQRDASEKFENACSGPMVYIANNWTQDSPLDIRVFSNCEEVALYINGTLVEKRKPNMDKFSTNLAHPPFTFVLPTFEPGELVAKAYIGDKEVAKHIVRTPEEAKKIEVALEDNITNLIKDDIIFVYAKIVDANNTVVQTADNLVSFKVEGNAKLIGENPIKAEAGIAAILLKVDKDNGNVKITADGHGLESGSYNI
jgi:beta-galactosidase